MAIDNSNTFFFARQPILDREGQISAYELLYRSNTLNAATNLPKNATEQVVANALNLTGLGNLIDKGTKAFINIDEHMLFSDILNTIPKSHFIFELLETIDFTDAVIEQVKTLYEEGYTFALDDLICSESTIETIKPVLPFVKIIKLEKGQNTESLRPFIVLFKEMGLSILAEKVQTKEEYTELRELGCDLFQGYFFARPTLISGNKVDPKAALVLHAITLLCQNKIEETLELFAQDAALTLQLLRYINSAAFSFHSDIKSTRQAFTLLGNNPLKQWLTLMSYVISSEDGIYSPLLKLAQERANMMILLSEACIGKGSTEQAGFVGMLSLIDALFQRPMEELLHELHIDVSISDILLRSDNCKIENIYQLVLAVESFDNNRITQILGQLDLDIITFSILVKESYRRSEAFMQTLLSS